MDFRDEVVTANLAAKDLRKRGVKAIVVLLHEGGLPPSGARSTTTATPAAPRLSGPIVAIARASSRRSTCSSPVTPTSRTPATSRTRPASRGWVTSAASFGRVITDTELKLDRRTRDVIRSSVTTVNHAVTRDVAPPGADRDRSRSGTTSPPRSPTG